VEIVSGLGACGELRKLYLNGARYVADLSGLGRLSELTSLSLDSTLVSDVRELASCAALQVTQNVSLHITSKEFFEQDETRENQGGKLFTLRFTRKSTDSNV
jgi:hypothetical protein